MANGVGGREVGRISIRVVPDTSKFRRRLRESLSEIEKREEATIQVGLDPSGAKAHFRELMASLKATAARGVQVSVDIDRHRMANLASGIAGALSNIGQDAGKAFSSGLSAGMNTAGGAGKSGLAGVAGMGALVAAIAALIAPAIAVVSTALVSLPGLITAAVVPIGALALGMDGLKKAAAQLAEPLAKLKEVMAKKTEDVFTPILAKLKDVFPTLSAQLPKVTQGLGNMASSVVNTVTSAQGLDRIRFIIGDISQAMTNAAPGIGAFTSGMTGLATAFASKLPAIGTWLSKIGTQFDQWVTKVTSNGQLSAAFDNLGAAIQPVVGLIGDLVAKGIEWMSDPKFGQALVTTFNDIRDAINATMAVLGPMFQILSATLTTILAPLRLFTGEFEKLPLLLQVPVKLIGTLVSSITGLFSGIDWGAMWTGLTTAASAAWEAVKATASEAWNSLISGVSGAMSSMVSAVTEGVTNVVAKIGELGGKVVAAASNFGSLLVDAGRNIVQGLINGISSMVGSVISTVTGIASQVAGAFKGALGIHSPSKVFTEFGVNISEGLANGIRDSMPVVKQSGEDLADGVKTGFNNEIDPNKYVQGSVGMMQNFVTATADQAMSDLGISGSGALPTIAKDMANWGVSKATNVTYNVSGVDEAMALERNRINKEALRHGLPRVG